MFRPLLELVAERPVRLDEVAGFATLALDEPRTPDLGPLLELFTATQAVRHVAGDWTGDYHTRRAVQLHPSASSWVGALREVLRVVYQLLRSEVMLVN